MKAYRALCATAAAATALATVGAGPALADTPDGQVVVVPGDPGGVIGAPSIDLSAAHPGSSSRPGHGGTSAAEQGVGTEGDAPACTYTPTGMTPSQMFEQLGTRTVGYLPGDGKAAYWLTCNGITEGWVPGPSQGPPGANGAAAPVLPTPEQLAAQAFAQLVLPLPAPRFSPDLVLADGRSATLVGEHTWLWTDKSVWVSQTKRVQVGPVWAEVTATPTSMSFDPGTEGSTLGCSGPGTPYDRSKYGVHAPSPDCDYVFARSSYGMAGDETAATYGISWHVAWVGSTGTAPAGGALPDMISRATARFAVAEAQALRTG